MAKTLTLKLPELLTGLKFLKNFEGDLVQLTRWKKKTAEGNSSARVNRLWPP